MIVTDDIVFEQYFGAALNIDSGKAEGIGGGFIQHIVFDRVSDDLYVSGIQNCKTRDRLYAVAWANARSTAFGSC